MRPAPVPISKATSIQCKALLDANILVYWIDPTDAVKQAIAEEVMSEGLKSESVVIAHQALIEWMAVVQRPQARLNGQALLPNAVAVQQAEWLMRAFDVIYPDPEVMATALRGQATFGLSWFDAHLWAYAEVHGIGEILSEDFQHGRYYGSVRVVNPFLSKLDPVHELPAMYEVSSR